MTEDDLSLDDLSPSDPARVLTVDDEEPVLELVSTVLSNLGGFEVETASDGRFAIERLEDDTVPTPDLVVLDVMMPGIDGLAVLAWIRQHDYLFDLPVVMLTAKTGPGDEAEGWRHGCDAYVSKPFDPRQLVEVVTTTLAAGPELRIARRADRLREVLAT